MAIEVDLESFRVTAANLKRIGAILAQSAAVREAGRVLEDETRANVSLSDHSLGDLANHQPPHPYARRYGKIQIHNEKPWVVHQQSGNLLRSLTSRNEPTAQGQKFSVKFDLSRADHARYVVLGTTKMLPRNVIWNTANDKRVQKLMMRAIVRVYGKDFRTKARLRFNV